MSIYTAPLSKTFRMFTKYYTKNQKVIPSIVMKIELQVFVQLNNT